MKGMIISGIIVIIGLIILIIILLKKQYQLKKDYGKQYIEENKEKLNIQLDETITALRNLEDQRDRLNIQFNEKKQSYEQFVNQQTHMTELFQNQQQQLKAAAEKSTQEFIASRKELMETNLQHNYDSEVETYVTDLEMTKFKLLTAARQEFEACIKEYEEKIDALNKEVEDFQTRRDAINEQILRQRAIDEKQDFYRICITDNDLEDIDLILSLRQKLHKTSFLDKITYDTFVSKYVKEMAKRVLEGRNPTGIYKVTNIKTNEVYIGKSTTVADRWQNHAKGAFGVGEIGDSQFQRALKKYGLQNFTWELLEETTKDKLTEREKYYITFYDTVHYGYNMKVG